MAIILFIYKSLNCKLRQSKKGLPSTPMEHSQIAYR